FMVPADRIEMRGDKDDEYRVNVSKQQIETFPAYDETHLRDEKKWKDYEEKYRKASGWTEAGVLHQQDTTRIITPDQETVSPTTPHIRSGDYAEGLEPNQLPRQAAGPMNTAATAWGQTPENTRLHETGVARMVEGSTQRVSDYGATSRFDSERKVESRPDVSSDDVPRTIEGDTLFNEEDVHHLRLRHNDPPDLDRRSRVEGAVGSGSYLGAQVGRRWSRFEDRLKEERGRITSSCTVCDSLRNRHREDAADGRAAAPHKTRNPAHRQNFLVINQKRLLAGDGHALDHNRGTGSRSAPFEIIADDDDVLEHVFQV